jgi:hypothetical protein
MKLDDKSRQPLECIRCHMQMELGYLVDTTGDGLRQQRWCPGAPERSFWIGLKVKKGTAVPVVTHRCPNCGYLESYAVASKVREG